MLYLIIGLVIGLIIGCIIGASEPSSPIPRPPIQRSKNPNSGDKFKQFLKPKEHGIR